MNGKKGFAVGDMMPLGLTIVVLGIALSLGLTVLNDFNADNCADDNFFNTSQGQCYNSSTNQTSGQVVRTDAFNGTDKATDGVNKFVGYIPTIALVIVVAVIIGIVVRYLFRT